LKVKGFGVYPISREAAIVAVSSFTGQLGNLALPITPTTLLSSTTLMRLPHMPASLVPMKIWRLQNLYALIKLDQLDKSLYNYTHEFNSSLSFWKDDISIKAAAYTYIAGLKVGALRADLMTNW